MVKSMTGFGKSEAQSGGILFSVEMKSVNHRYSEILIRLPREWNTYEDQIKKRIQSVVKRGRVDVFISVVRDVTVPKTVLLDWGLAEGLVQAAAQLKERLHLEGALQLSELLALPGMVQMKEESGNTEELSPFLLQAVDEACERLATMRYIEGQALFNDMMNRLQLITEEIETIQARSPQVVEDYRSRLTQRMQELLPAGLEANEGRILAEAAIFAERISIDEEIIRLQSHLAQFHQYLTEEDSIGRKLDFLVQEMNREVNTMGSKANDVLIGQKVVLLKSELEKMREQVQNME